MHTYLSSPTSEEGLAALNMTLTSEIDRQDVHDMLRQFQTKLNMSAKELDLWKVKHAGVTVDQPTGEMIPKLPKGYKQTSHAAEFDIKSKWVPLTNDGCNPASIAHK